jgi:hypothetical protein
MLVLSVAHKVFFASAKAQRILKNVFVMHLLEIIMMKQKTNTGMRVMFTGNFN